MPKESNRGLLRLLLGGLLLGDGLGADLLRSDGLDTELAATPLSAVLNVVVVGIFAELGELGELSSILNEQR